MSDYAICKLAEVPDVLGDYPGEMRFLTGPLEAKQVALTFRRMPAQTGGKGGYGHRHKTQEEIYLVLSGRLEFKLEDQVVELEGGTAVRVAPHVTRSVWNEGPEDAELVICSVRVEDLQDEGEIIQDFWPRD